MWQTARAGLALATAAALVAVATAGYTLEGDMAELAAALRAACLAETGAAPPLLDRVNAGEDLPDDGKLKCYIKCTMEAAGMLADGAVDLEALLAILPDDFRARNEGNLRACGTQRGADDCDTAYKTQQCWQNANRQDYFLI